MATCLFLRLSILPKVFWCCHRRGLISSNCARTTLAPDCRSMFTEKDELWHFHSVTQRLPWTSSIASSMWSSLWWSLWYGCWSLESQLHNCWCSYHHKCCSSSLCLGTRAKLSLKRSSSSSSCILSMLAIGAWLMEFRYLTWSSLTDLQV